MNEDCRKRGLSNKKILTVVAISTLLLSSGNVIATQTTIDGSLRVTEQLQTQIVNGLVVDVNGEPVIGASVVEKGTTNGGITDINGKFTLNVKPGSRLSGNLWLVSFKISYLCLPLFYETRTTPSCHPSGCAYRQL